MTTYSWTCICGTHDTGDWAAQEHTKTCHRFGWPGTNPWVDEQRGKR